MSDGELAKGIRLLDEAFTYVDQQLSAQERDEKAKAEPTPKTIS